MIVEIWGVFCELAPWLLFGTLLSSLLHVLLPTEFARTKLSGKGGVVRAVLFGVPLPLCSCGVVPAGLGLKKDGASDGASIAFLISTPQTGVDSILVASSVFGWPFAIFKMLVAAVTGVVGGLITNWFRAPELITDRSAVPPTISQQSRSWSDFWQHGHEVLHSIWGWLLVGVIVSAAINQYVPESFFRSIGGHGVMIASAFALLVSLPLYVCATASIPIAAALVANGLPAGAALVFLIAGPATNAATIGAIFGKFGWRPTLVYLGTIIVGSFGGAFLFEVLLNSELVSLAHAHEHRTWWHQLSAVILLGLLIYYAVTDLKRFVAKRRTDATDGRLIQIEVSGMTCGGCANKLESALKRSDQIDSAVVTLNPDQATVKGNISLQGVRDIVEASGFSVDKV